MGIFSRLFGGGEEKKELENPVYVDFHSHLLPGLDDGVDDFEESVEIIKAFAQMGYKKLITTPHVMSDFYQNSAETILPKLEELRSILREQNISIEISAAGEYYLDAGFSELTKQKKVLTFGDRYVLVETAFMNKNEYLQNFIFDLKIAGFQPILAHPERYIYLYSDMKKYREIYEKEVLFQINLGSLAGYYSKEAKKIAEQLIKENMVDFVGSDVHHLKHIPVIQAALQSPALHQLAASGKLKNNSLLT